MNKFFEWCGRHRKTFGYVGYMIGALNIIAGINDLIVGNPVTGTLCLVIGSLILLDARTFTKG